MSDIYKGTIVEESLTDSRFVNELKITSVRISEAEHPADRWHLYGVEISKSNITKFSQMLKSEKWYAHFWNEDTIIVVYPGKQFTLLRHDKNTWHDAIEFGRSLGIPYEQLDFLVE